MKVFSNGNFKDSITTEYIDKKIVFINQTDEIYIGNVSKYKNIMFLFKKDSKNNKVKEETYKESYEQTGVEERKEEASKIVQLKRKIMSIIKGKEVNENER